MPAAKQVSPKRQELIEIASRLFYEQGYGATGVKQIIEAAGIAKGTFYSHFSSKEELGLAWLRDRHHRWNQWLAAELDPLETAGEKLLGCYDFLSRWMDDSDYRGCAFLNTGAETPDPDSPLREVVVAHKQELLDKFQKLAASHYPSTGGSRAGKILEAAHHKGTILFLLFEGALVEAQNFRDQWPIQAARSEAECILAAPLS